MFKSHRIVFIEARKDKTFWDVYDDGLKLPRGTYRNNYHNILYLMMKGLKWLKLFLMVSCLFMFIYLILSWIF